MRVLRVSMFVHARACVLTFANARACPFVCVVCACARVCVCCVCVCSCMNARCVLSVLCACVYVRARSEKRCGCGRMKQCGSVIVVRALCKQQAKQFRVCSQARIEPT